MNETLGRQEVMDWLLEPENPSVRYWTLVDLLGLPHDDPEVRAAQGEIMTTGPVARILERQTPDGGWGKPEDFYERSKYRGTVWNLILLAELGADPADERIQRAARFVLDVSQERQDGGFSALSAPSGGGDPSLVIPCLTGNMLWSMARFGMLDDERVQKGFNWITTYQRFDDGVKNPPSGGPYAVRVRCWGRHTCHMGAVKALKALAEVPPERRTPSMQATIEEGAEFMLAHHIYRKSHHLERVAMPKWLNLGFPLFYNTDILEILAILARLGYRDERMRDALDVVKSKQDGTGRWISENSWYGRMLVTIDTPGRPSKWITLKALSLLGRTGLS